MTYTVAVALLAGAAWAVVRWLARQPVATKERALCAQCMMREADEP